MCGRFNLTATPEKIIQTFHLQRLLRYETSYNIPPGQKILTIVQLGDGRYKAVYLYWGLTPHWAKDRKISNHLINARVETIAEKPSFREAYKQRRCLIPATGFYEWKKLEQGKQAYCISHKKQQLFAFAGLWEYWEQGTESIYSCTIITSAANKMIKPIHQRMPVIINNQNYTHWLDKQASQETTQKLLKTDAYQEMTLKMVSDWVNNPHHNDKNCMT
ncbi:MAG: SOS response-associated peptidase [Methylococcales bacterium]|nr:SOS response-associated peptidase [Methylococcales bacterium]